MLGSGTQTDPYRIQTPADLNAVRNNLSAYYELANDLDMAGFGNFTPIGTSSSPFTGHFDGKGYKILNLTINVSAANVGLFGYINNGGIVQNLGLENCNITGNAVNYVGGIVGYLYNGTVQNCYTKGSIIGQYGIGGIVGWFNIGIIRNCFSRASVTGKGRVGGLLGHGVSANAVVEKCYSTGLVTVTPDPNNYNGGLVGSYTVTPPVFDSYWDIETSGQTISAGGIGKTTAEMKNQSTYVNWDFANVWGINGDYPYLRIFGVPGKSGNITITSFIETISSDTSKLIKGNKTGQSFINKFYSSTSKSTKKYISSFIKPIYSSVEKQVRTVISRKVDLTSYILPINGKIERKIKSNKVNIAYIKHIFSSIFAKLPLLFSGGKARVFYFENLSHAGTIENLSRTGKLENLSKAWWIE
ncbi:GLUG motif-containing protein [Thermosediminibacter oceani]|uniref:GLUG domain-containing protein n=1 Tax=Thermosediminibacter oceani (strain ATCC BAA-1034 / DSM 16646 / JW/IW-1228P) TaxID=555079 RepID=D9S2X4_THEOJ|nr:GLUG motif-containing protein [Thermosediminibacter oceani]ADL07751.1 hypothetical protein Toce_0989 [Thermosediminibacter oceani DSM 16646]